MEKSVLTISRKWNNPQIKTTINNREISLEMNISDFEEALIKEIGLITFVLTEKQLRERVHKAIENILQGVKEESAKVV
jgi:hypothetical protein